jgi:hypothetical protein
MRRVTLALVFAGALTLGLPVASAQMLGPDAFGLSADVSRHNYAELDLYNYCDWTGDTQYCTGFSAREEYEEGTGRFQFTALLLQRQITAPTWNSNRYIVCRVPKRIIRLTAVDASFPPTALDPSSESCETGGYRIDCDENGENCSYNGDYGYMSVMWVEGAWNNPSYMSSGQGVSHSQYADTGERFHDTCSYEQRSTMTEGGLAFGARYIAFNPWVYTQFSSQTCTTIGK